MKKVLHLSTALLFSSVALAQLPVSTAVSKRVAILEEFTGLNCQFCPDGHRISNEIQAANAGKMFAINIHSGSFATPNPGQPDFRTTEGTAIDAAAQAAAAGYPTGGINRGASGWGKISRDQWGTKVDAVIAENSPVNIALEGSIDINTRKLTVDVEIYYTSAPAQATQYLNVALVQNNIAGPQVDGGNYNPTGWVDRAAGIYNHMHMFRRFVNTTSKGDAITVAVGSVITKQYVITLPDKIGDVSVELPNLELVAFLTEAQNYTSKIVSGGHGEIALDIPAGVSLVDLSSAALHTLPETYCASSFVPKVTVKNTVSSSSTIDTFQVSYTLNGTTVSANVYQSLAVGETYTHTFPSATLIEGTNTITYKVSTGSDSSSLDLITSNDETSESMISILPSDVAGTDMTEDFENPTGDGYAPNQAISVNPNSIDAFITDAASAYGEGTNSFMWFFYNTAPNLLSSFIFEKVDFSSVEHPIISFDHAYASYSGEKDQLKVDASIDCGDTWVNLFKKSGSTLATAANTEDNYVPTAEEWVSNKLDASLLIGQSEVIVRFEGTSKYGNNLFVDNIYIGNDLAWGVKDAAPAISFEVYPNPANDVLNISLNLESAEKTSVSVINALGEKVLVKDLGMSLVGQKTQTLDISNLNSGIYFVNITAGDKTASKKVTVIR